MILLILFPLISGILYGVAESINKNITEKNYSVFSYAFLQWSLNAAFYLIPFILFGTFPKDTTAYIYFIGVLISTFIGNLALIKAYKTEDISNVNIISKFSLVIAFVSGITFLQEKINAYKLLGVLSIVIGIIIIFYERKKMKLSEGFIFAIISSIFYGLTAYFQKEALNYFNIISLIFIFNFSISLLLLFIPNTRKDILPIFSKYKRQLLLSRIGIVTGVYFLFWSLTRGSISIINTNNETAFLLSTTTIGVILLKERENLAQKILGSLLCTLGIILLNFF